MLEKTVRINRLFDIYGELLTDRQASALKMYYHRDFSLAEIAEAQECSRQAVHDTLNRAASNLEKYERKLNFSERAAERKSTLKEVREKLAGNELGQAENLIEDLLEQEA